MFAGWNWMKNVSYDWRWGWCTKDRRVSFRCKIRLMWSFHSDWNLKPAFHDDLVMIEFFEEILGTWLLDCSNLQSIYLIFNNHSGAFKKFHLLAPNLIFLARKPTKTVHDTTRPIATFINVAVSMDRPMNCIPISSLKYGDPNSFSSTGSGQILCLDCKWSPPFSWNMSWCSFSKRSDGNATTGRFYCTCIRVGSKGSGLSWLGEPWRPWPWGNWNCKCTRKRALERTADRYRDSKSLMPNFFNAPRRAREFLSDLKFETLPTNSV